MPYFSMRLTVNKELLQRLQELPDRARRNLYTRLRTDLAPELEADANSLMEQGPEPVSSPFAFGSPRSKRFYHALVDKSGLSDGVHWIRTGDIETSFVAEVAGKLTQNIITVRNLNEKGKYLYGPWLVSGHKNTGWPDQLDVSRQLLEEKVRQRIGEMWKAAVDDAIRGRE